MNWIEATGGRSGTSTAKAPSIYVSVCPLPRSWTGVSNG
jgi:hypothetical protein